MYRYIGMCALVIGALQADQNVTFKNNTEYGVKVIMSKTVGQSAQKRIYSNMTESINIETIACAKYIEFQFYNLPDDMRGRPTGWPGDARLPLKDNTIDGKPLKGFYTENGKIYYNLGATWGAFYCQDFTLTLDDNGAITLSD